MKIFPNNFNSFFLFWKRNIFWFFLSLSPEKVLSISFLWMVAVNNRLFQKTKNKEKNPDHMKKNVNKQLIIWKKNSRKSRDLHVYREDWKRSHIYNKILWQRTKKILVFCCLIYHTSSKREQLSKYIILECSVLTFKKIMLHVVRTYTYILFESERIMGKCVSKKLLNISPSKFFFVFGSLL